MERKLIEFIIQETMLLSMLALFVDYKKTSACKWVISIVIFTLLSDKDNIVKKSSNLRRYACRFWQPRFRVCITDVLEALSEKRRYSILHTAEDAAHQQTELKLLG